MDTLHFTIYFFLQMIVYFASCFHYLLNLIELFFKGFNILIVLKLNHAHPYDFLFKLFHILLILIVDTLALRDAGGQYLATGPPLEQVMIST